MPGVRRKHVKQDLLEQLDVFYGDLTVNRAIVYVRLQRSEAAEGLTFSGFVRGPRCARAQTLPLSTPLVDMGPGPTLLGKSIVPDPCFWSPDLPAIYDVTVQLLRGTEVLGAAQRQIGLRAFGVRGRNLVLEGKRVVLRGVLAESAQSHSPRDWQAAQAQYVATDPPDELLAEASSAGALAAIEVAESGAAAAARLRGLARFPAVAIAIIRGTLPDNFQRASAAPNLLLAQTLNSASVSNCQPWADLAMVSTTDRALLAAAAGWNFPVLAMRPLGSPLPLAEARVACDALQRDLAPIGQFAGYVV
jgi:hypothetical protein